MLAQEDSLGLRLERAWGKIQWRLMELTAWRSQGQDNLVFGLSERNRETAFWLIFSGGLIEEA